jgi:hypothetical protein
MQHPASFMCHTTIGYKINRNKLSHEIALQLLDITGSKEYMYLYNYRTDRPEMMSGSGTIPNLYYKIEF